MYQNLFKHANCSSGPTKQPPNVGIKAIHQGAGLSGLPLQHLNLFLHLTDTPDSYKMCRNKIILEALGAHMVNKVLGV